MGIEVFVAILLISVAAAGVAGFETFVHEPSGLGTNNVATASLTDIGDDAADTNRKVTRILESIASAPGVQSVATMNITPLTGETTRATFSARLSNGDLRARAGMWPEEVSLNYFPQLARRLSVDVTSFQKISQASRFVNQRQRGQSSFPFRELNR